MYINIIKMSKIFVPPPRAIDLPSSAFVPSSGALGDAVAGSAANVGRNAAQGAAGDIATEAAQRTARDGATDAVEAAARRGVDSVPPPRTMLQKGGDAVAAGAKRTARAAADNAKALIAAGLVVGGGLYLEKKFKDADEDIKNCINVCLPENWDDYEYGDLDKSELKYRVLEGEDANPDQPLCTEAKDDCGEFCGNKCEDLHEYELPGSNAAAGVGKGVGKGLGGLFGGLAKGLGKLFDPSGMASKFSLIMIILIIVMTAIRMIKK